MPFAFPLRPVSSAQRTVCPACYKAGNGCLADVRGGKVKGRDTEFQITQRRVLDCAFEDFVPGGYADDDITRSFKSYRAQAYANTRAAGEVIWGDKFKLSTGQIAKVDGDIYEMMEAAALWNAAVVWNSFMDTGRWRSKIFERPANAVPSPARKVAIVKMARGADTTLLLNAKARSEYEAFERGLKEHNMELRLSTPDILGLRMPDPAPPGFRAFRRPIYNLSYASQDIIETAWRGIQGTLEGRHFMFAIAVKTSTRSDRLYQALFEANVLKYILGYVLRGPAIRFHAHIENFAGADVVGRYSAASMTSLLAGGTPNRAIDVLYRAVNPRETAQMVLNTLPSYPL